MLRTLRYLLPTLVAIDLAWRTFSGQESIARDLIHYNSIWLIALLSVLAAPLAIDRVAIAAIALAITSWGLGSLAASIDEFLLPAPRFSILSQILYSLFYPLILVAIPRLCAVHSKLKPIELLDSLIFGLGFTSIITAVLTVAIFPSGSLFASEDFFLIFYPVGDVAVLLISVTTLITRGFHRQLALLSLGVGIFALTDIYYLWQAIHRQYSFGGFADSFWLMAICMIAIAATFESKNNGAIAPIHPALVAVSIFISPILLAVSALKPEIFPIYILFPSIANLIFAFIRMSTTLREARQLNSERALARTDELTGLANRRKLLADINNFSEVEGALLLLDLDDFKPVNDQFGHEVGDLILRQVAQRFTRTVPHGSVIARLGGDEFGILLRGNYEETLEVAHALRACLTYPFTIQGQRISVGVSVGIVHNDGAGNLLQRADSAMYKAKQMDMGVAQL